MVATGILTMIVVWCMFYGVIPTVWLALLCVVLGVIFAVLSRHEHGDFFDIDMQAQRSRLLKMSPALKNWSVIALMFICIASNSPWVGLGLAVFCLIMTVIVGGIELHDYVALMAIPLVFMLISGLALLFEFGPEAAGVINIPLFGIWMFVPDVNQAKTILVMAKAFGAISCLYLLSLSTPMVDIIGVLRRAHIPDVVASLMYLIYRCTFIMLEMHHSMKDAATCRLGYCNLSTSIRTTGQIYSNLFARSYKKANNMFDAMESRCYDGDVEFYSTAKPITAVQAVFAIAVIVATLSATIVLY